MLSERARRWLHDIIQACLLIERWTAEAGGAEAMIADDKHRSAVERQLLLISEAAIRLRNAHPDALDTIVPGVDWAGVRGMGNVIRHRYDDMDHAIVADVAANKIMTLRLACEKALGAA